MEIANELAAQRPHIVDVFLDRLRRQIRRYQMFQERTEQHYQLLAGRQILFQAHPRVWPALQSRSNGCEAAMGNALVAVDAAP